MFPPAEKAILNCGSQQAKGHIEALSNSLIARMPVSERRQRVPVHGHVVSVAISRGECLKAVYWGEYCSQQGAKSSCLPCAKGAAPMSLGAGSHVGILVLAAPKRTIIRPSAGSRWSGRAISGQAGLSKVLPADQVTHCLQKTLELFFLRICIASVRVDGFVGILRDKAP